MTASPLTDGSDRFGVNPALTGNTTSGPVRKSRRRRRSDVENDTYMAFAARIIRAGGRRIAAGDVESLADLASLQVELDQALTVAVEGLRDFGYSWAEIASRLGVTRQAAQQRWGSTQSSVSNTTAEPDGGLW